MKNKKLWIISILILVILFICAAANYKYLFYFMNRKYCDNDLDCVLVSYCHDTDVINKFHSAGAGGCLNGVIVLDYGCDKSICMNNRCIVERNANYSWCTK